MKILLFLLSSILFSQLSYAEIMAPEINSCEFYLSLEQELPCGPAGYAKDFGYPYCEKFLKSKFYRFSKKGKAFLLKNAFCLQNSIYTTYNQKEDISCKEVKDIGFKGHTDCYIESGFCELPISDKVILTNIIKDQLPLEIVRGQLKDVLKRCQQNKTKVSGYEQD